MDLDPKATTNELHHTTKSSKGAPASPRVMQASHSNDEHLVPSMGSSGKAVEMDVIHNPAPPLCPEPRERRLTVHDVNADEERDRFDFLSTLSFWAAVFFVEGSVLFTIGSICLYPAVNGSMYEWQYKAWVDYTFMIGAWCFTIGNYLIYFLTINGDEYTKSEYLAAGGVEKMFARSEKNKMSAEEMKKINCEDVTQEELERHHLAIERMQKCCRFIQCPPSCNMGSWGAVFAVIGALWYNVNTMDMFGDNKSETRNFNLWYVMTGSVGSMFFVLSSICEGEHNDWRTFCPVTHWLPWVNKRAMARIASVLNFWGALCFFIAYIVDYNRTADEHEWVEIYFVAGTFTVGSIFFAIASWIGLWMWKTEQFGLGFATNLDLDSSRLSFEEDSLKPQIPIDHSKACCGLTCMVSCGEGTGKAVSIPQQLMMVFYIGNICINWCLLGFVFALYFEWRDDGVRDARLMEVGFKLLVYHGVIFLASALHRVPDRVPWSYLMFFLRFTALYGFVTDTYLLSQYATMSEDYFDAIGL